MDSKKLLLAGLTVAGFLATSLIPTTATFAIAADESDKQDKGDMKKGSCSGMKGEKKEEK